MFPFTVVGSQIMQTSSDGEITLDQTEEKIVTNIFNNQPLIESNNNNKSLLNKIKHKVNDNENFALQVLNHFVFVYSKLNFYSFSTHLLS